MVQPDVDHEKLGNDLKARRAKLAEGGGIARIEAQHAKGKLTARERVVQLLDEGTFNEIDQFMVHRHSDFGLDKDRYPGDGIVAGFGKVNGAGFVYMHRISLSLGVLSEK